MTKRVFRVRLVGLVLLIVLFLVVFYLSSNRQNNEIKQDNTESVEQQIYDADLARQIRTAEGYEKGSYMWANSLLNAAIYAADHNLCQRADDLFTEVSDEPSTEKHNFDLKSLKERVYAKCQT